jgi:hypothetical protein
MEDVSAATWEDDAELDDGFPYELIGEDIMLERGQTGWIAPSAFMVVSMKELLQALVNLYGFNGHWLLQELGRDNLRNPEFVSKLGLGMFLRLYDTALAALPTAEQKRLGFVE